MSINDGQRVRAQESNAAWVSKTDTTGNEVTGIIDLNNTTDVNSGAQIPNAQEKINDNANRITETENDIADIRTTTGTVDGDTEMGAYTPGANGFSITDDQSTKTNIQELVDGVDARQLLSEKGQPDGYASLDGSGKLPVSQLPTSAMEYQGAYDASGGGSGSPSLTDGSGDVGDLYRVSVAGTVDHGSGNITYAVGDAVIYNGSIWQKIPAEDAVLSVNGQQGTVVLDTDDIAEGATNLYYTDTRADDRIAAASIDDLADVDTTTVPPNVDEALVWDGSNWVPGEAVGGDGQGLTNYLAAIDSNAEDASVIGDTTWDSFDDGSVSIPVDGTPDGGAANVSIDITSTTSEVIEGLQSFKFTKANGVDAQGEGVSCDSDAIANGLQGSLNEFEIWVNTTIDGSYTGTVGVWLRDYGAASPVLINVLESDNLIPKNYKGVLKFSFYLPNNGTSTTNVRPILMETDTNTTNYSFSFGKLRIGPDILSVTTPLITDWVDVTPSYTNAPAGISEGWEYRIDGPDILLRGKFTGSATGPASDFRLNVGAMLPQYTLVVGGDTSGGFCATYQAGGDAGFSIAGVQVFSSTEIRVFDNDSGSTLQGSAIISGTQLRFDLRLKVNELSNNTTEGLVRNSQLQFEEAIMTADVGVDGTLSDLTISNLIPGRQYETTGVFAITTNSSADAIFVEANHDSNTLGFVGGNQALNQSTYYGFSFKFTATSSTLTFIASSIAAGNLVRGNGTKDFSYIQVREQPFTNTAIVNPIGNLITDNVSAAVDTVAANTYIDSGASITLSPGTYEIGYDVSLTFFASSLTGNQGGNVVVTDSSNVLVPQTLSTAFASMNTGVSINFFSFPCSRKTEIVVTSTTTYKLRHRCSVAPASGIARVEDELFSGSLSDPDNESIIWARRLGV